MLDILIVEDELHNREAMSEIITRLNCRIDTASDGNIALKMSLDKEYDLILTDIRMPNMDGITLFDSFHALNKSFFKTHFAFMTAYGRMEEAIDLMRRGALHFLTKPLKKRDIVLLLEEVEKRKAHPVSLREQVARPLGNSHAFKNILKICDQIAHTATNVLITGESGTGKEIIARYIHDSGARTKRPFVAFHSSGVPETLMESELFGFEKGAFTGANHSKMGLIRAAEGGSFFIDELASMSLSSQTKLLRIIQDKLVQPIGATKAIQCDVRWIAATNRDLFELSKQGLFREDLLYRLSVLVIELPPLRSRKEDIAELTDSFVDEFCKRENRTKLKLSSQVVEIFQNYTWPGNIRELKNIIERAVVLTTTSELDIDSLPQYLSNVQSRNEIIFKVGTSLQSVEDALIEQTLKSCQGDKNTGAMILGVAPRTLYRWIEKREMMNLKP